MKKQDDHKCTFIGVLVQEYVETLRKNKYSPATLRTYGDILDRFGRYLAGCGIERVQDIGVEDLDAYRLGLIERNFSSQGMNTYLRCVRAFFRFLEHKQHILINPGEQMAMPRLIRPLQPVPSREDIRKLLDQPDVSAPSGIRDRAFLEVAYSTAVRRAELAGMNLADVDLGQGLVRVMGKGSKERMLPLGKTAVEWLTRYIEQARPAIVTALVDEQALWLGAKGRGRLNPQILGSLIRDYGNQAGINISIGPHSIRRACATHMLESGAHPAQIQMLLGHANVRALTQYLRVSITALQEAHARSKPGQ